MLTNVFLANLYHQTANSLLSFLKLKKNTNLEIFLFQKEFDLILMA